MTQSFIIKAKDGYPLKANYYKSHFTDHTTLLIAGATGVPNKFYEKFAEYFSQNGYNVLTFDYRGIGESKNENLREFQTDFIDWAQKDLGGALDWSLARHQTIVIGHSFGGQAFGLVENANSTQGLYAFGSSIGWRGHMNIIHRLKAFFLWNAIGPLLTQYYGYFPSHLVKLGEDLPLGVYNQWKEWSKYPRYFFDDPEFIFKDDFKKITVPITAIYSSDDAWAPAKSVQALMNEYSNSITEFKCITPKEHNLTRIGHMGYFHPKFGKELWPLFLKWFRQA